MAHPKIYL